MENKLQQIDVQTVSVRTPSPCKVIALYLTENITTATLHLNWSISGGSRIFERGIQFDKTLAQFENRKKRSSTFILLYQQ